MLSCGIAPFNPHESALDPRAQPLRRLIAPIVDFCFPLECAACSRRYERAAGESAVLCAACDQHLDEIARRPSCHRCAMPAPAHGAPCPHCHDRGVTPYERVLSLGVFVDPLKKLVHRAKYSGRWMLAEELADRIVRRADVRDALAGVDLIVPVPLHRWRQVARGYNQAEVIARSFARAAGKRVVDVAVRAHHTSVQAQIHSRKKRFDNLRDAFVLERPAVLTGKRVMVVDDVLTSGATLVAMGRTLTAARPAALLALVLAVADPKGRSFEVI